MLPGKVPDCGWGCAVGAAPWPEARGWRGLWCGPTVPSELTLRAGLGVFPEGACAALASGFADFSAAPVAGFSVGTTAFGGAGGSGAVEPMLETDMMQPFWLIAADWTGEKTRCLRPRLMGECQVLYGRAPVCLNERARLIVTL